MSIYLMKCGHPSNATDSYGNPACAICVGMHPGATEIDHEITDPHEGLEDRVAHCTYCSETSESRWTLPFFEYRPDRETDSFYCGCRGWD